MKTWYFEVIVEENGQQNQQYYGQDEQLALEILHVDTYEMRHEIKAGKAKVYLTCK
jgi:hypothetical protein